MQYARVATCALDQWALDFDGNLARTRRSIEEAKRQGARYRVGPELELSGYGCEDHFHEIDTFVHSAEALAELLQSGVMEDIICDVGIAILHNSVPYNCRALCLGKRILCIRPKLFLADDGNYREPRWFTRWERMGEVDEHRLCPALERATKQRTVPFGDCCIETLDTKLASETCEELFTPNSPHINLGLAGVELLGNGSGSHHELRKLHTRVDLIRSATEKSGGVYLYSNQLGCDGGRLLFDGCALIAVNGKVVAQGSQFSLKDVEVVVATIDLQEIRAYRISKASRGVQAAQAKKLHCVSVDFSISDPAGAHGRVSRPIEVRYHTPQEEIAFGPACWLWDYLRRSGASGFFLPLSGGADSSSTATIVGAMCRLVAEEAKVGTEQVIKDARRIVGEDPEGSAYLPVDPCEFANRIMHSAYLGTSNSSQGTQDFAKQLADTIGNYHLYVNIDPVVTAIFNLFVAVTGKTPRFRVHGGSYAENLALQNIQARFRMLMSYFLAQLLPWVRGNSGWLLVLGSGNVDEGLRGYLTKYDCSSADLNPIGGISKVDLKAFLHWASTKQGMGYKVLEDIASAPPTAELEPITDTHVQTDEEDMGMTYAELGWFGRLRKISHCGPVSMFKRLVVEWSSQDPKAVADKVKFFFKSYARNRHKATTLTPSVHCESYGVDDNRFDLRPIFVDPNFPWQFRKIDDLVARIRHAPPDATTARM
ncbi:Glutamine-dependent NAD(+) synthetase (NAD(+) synthase [glutamine-hydrolyzing]) [Durusdinium trenchii]|uniref:Glutamine-dependent NAD(+) synthetase n=1 Tax=Durusdinium trenchii TaxID=1381693 RepID=A0ABP0LWG4_9DINO